MKNKALYNCIQELFLFKNVPTERIEELLDNLSPELKQFLGEELIYSPDEFSTKIGFVIKGACTVERHRSDGTPIQLNALKPGDAFGVLGVFSPQGEFPTFVRAKKETSVLFFDKEDVLRLVRSEPEIALNIMYFMGDRIAFLNNKVSTFSADNAEQKVAKYLMYESKRLASRTFDFNCKRTSEALNIGRASLYRAIDVLTSEGIVKLENKKIYISDPIGLERITK